MPASASCGGIFDYDLKRERLEEVSAQLEAPDIWNDPKKAQDLGREKKALETIVEGIASIETGLADSGDLLAMARDEDDESTFVAVVKSPLVGNSPSPVTSTGPDSSIPSAHCAMSM